MDAHPLRREIIVNGVVNDLVNRQELSLVFRLQDQTGSSPSEVVRAYTVTRDTLRLSELWMSIDALDGRVPADVQMGLLLAENQRVEWITRWLLRQRRGPIAVMAELERYAHGVVEVLSRLPDLLVPRDRESFEADVAALACDQVPLELARRVAGAKSMPSLLDVVELSAEMAEPADAVCATYFAVGERLQLGWLREQIDALPSDSQWEMLARLALQEDLYGAYRAATRSVLATRHIQASKDRIDAWVSANQDAARRCDLVIGDIRSGERPDAGTLGVVLRAINNFISGTSAG